MLLPLLFLAGCPTVENPTGDCAADGDGSRTCTHAPEAGDIYLPDCAAPLDREYWRVFAPSEASAYVFPRPDGATATAQACADGDADVLAALDTYGLCGGPADPDVVNDMALVDAFTITRALHERLAFVAADGAGEVDPHVPFDDAMLICADPDAVLDAWCAAQAARQTGDDCTDIGIVMSAEEAEAVALAANRLYGID